MTSESSCLACGMFQSEPLLTRYQMPDRSKLFSTGENDDKSCPSLFGRNFEKVGIVVEALIPIEIIRFPYRIAFQRRMGESVEPPITR